MTRNFVQQTIETGTAVMHGKSSKLAAAALMGLLYAQGLLGIAAVTLVMLKDRPEPGKVVLSASAQPATSVQSLVR
ncbi:hypothetical protein ABMA32_13355 [Mesorhizobium sp. VNQ89]|uniref:hypothetical protein n=1 Tax=Mesorhizobium quangtriensis TaxID=3157709 RepID=UPI0032B74423